MSTHPPSVDLSLPSLFLLVMISELSKTGQYICTTFRPELIPHAESYFGVVRSSLSPP